jgi:cardiolipin synthase A/B
VLVVDGRLAFTGGTGIGEKWTGDGRRPGHLRQTDAAVEGPIVLSLQAAFAETWRDTTGILLGGDAYFPELEPRGQTPAQAVRSSPRGGSTEAYALFLLAIEGARTSIQMSTPYFVPDAGILDALLKASKRGVRVAVIVAARSADGVWVSIGSINVDNRSFALNHELNLVVNDPALARRLEQIFQDDLRFSRDITLEAWKRRGIGHLLELFVLPFSNLL